MAKEDDTGTRPSPGGSSSADSSDTPDAKTDYAEVPISNKSFEALHGAKTSAAYERENRPYAPLPKEKSTPTMAQLWAYAHRRYARFQGYAWGGVVIVGGIVWGCACATPPQDSGRVKMDPFTRKKPNNPLHITTP